ncbi:hypothetical protein QYE76_054043 [Lolium multiflorum]|uniref:Uncharacterized protein n=1 Tax=Lolium multiflorum TaxID=4521 RepID=A0AAD8SXI8_LOLMU|nr:hypothetical protein QYE76_054043 [Lolium multiflorum]
MATSSASTSVATALGGPPTKKLTRVNFLLWKMQVLPALRGALVMGLLDGSDPTPPKTLEEEDSNKKVTQIPNPVYGVWLVRDQQVLSWLVKTLSSDILAHVLDVEHCVEVWASIQHLFSSQSKAQINTLHGSLSNTKKLDMKAEKYITKMKGFAMELAAAGKKIDDDELKGYILNGLGAAYTPFVASINAVPSTTLADMCAQLTAYDQREAMLSETGQEVGSFQTSANDAARGRGRPTRPNNPRGDHGDFRGNYGGNDRGNYGGNDFYRGNYGGNSRYDYHQGGRGIQGGRGNLGGRGGRNHGGGRGRGASRIPTPFQDVLCQICKKNLAILQINVGGAIRIARMMMMTLAMIAKVHMAWTPIGTWTLVLPTTSLES